MSYFKEKKKEEARFTVRLCGGMSEEHQDRQQKGRCCELGYLYCQK